MPQRELICLPLLMTQAYVWMLLQENLACFPRALLVRGAADAENNKKLLDCLQHEKNRKAHYHCAIVFVRNVNDPEPIICEGQWYGEILLAARGRNGFGYDPIFLDFKTEKSAAELAPEVKNRISHRGQALQKLKQKFRIIYA